MNEDDTAHYKDQCQRNWSILLERIKLDTSSANPGSRQSNFTRSPENAKLTNCNSPANKLKFSK